MRLNPLPKFSIFNLGSEKGFSVKDIISTAEEIIGKKIKIEIGSRRLGDPDILVASSSLAKESLNWMPQESIENIIRHAWSWETRKL